MPIRTLNPNASTLQGFKATDLATPLTVVEFQKNAATGSAENPQRMNDNDTGNQVSMDAINKYAEVDFGRPFYITEFRHFGWASQNQDGYSKIQYWDGYAWQDLNTGIATRVDTWSSWIALTKAVVTNKIRLVATALDTKFSENNTGELEMRYE